LHAHDFLIRLHYLVAHLHEHLEGQFRALRGHHRSVQFLVLSAQEPLHGLIGGGAQVLHLADGVLECVLKGPGLAGRSRDLDGNGARRSREIGLIGLDIGVAPSAADRLSC